MIPSRSELRSEPVRDNLRQRKRKGVQSNDRFHVDKDRIPAGTSYEWKRHTVLGQSDPAYNVEMREQGWEAVDASRHPEFMPDGYTGPIVRDGMILMERPIELTQEAEAENRQRAFLEVRQKEEQLAGAPAGTFERTVVQVKKSHGNPLNNEGLEIPS